MSEPAIRQWIFSVEDFDDRICYLDSKGREVCEDEARDALFIGTNSEASREAQLRAIRWETRYDRLAALVTYHSLGKIQRPPRRASRRKEEHYETLD